MKIFTPKTHNRIVAILFLCFITVFSACNDDDDDHPCGGANGEGSGKSAKLVLESLNPSDQGNEGNASDIFLSCKFSGSLDKFEKLRFILKLSPSGFNAAKALKLTEGSYVETALAEYVEITLPESLKDADGMPISEGKPYIIFVLGIPSPCNGVPALLQGATTLTLVDEIIVTTPTLKSTLSANEDISIDEANNLYISGGSVNTSSLFKVTPDGTVSTLSTTLNYPVGNTLDGNGNLYVTNFGSININQITSAGVTSVFVADERLFRGGGIIMDNDGALFNTFWAIKTIYKITGAGVENYLTSDLLNGPVGVAYDHVNNNIFISNFNDGKILQVAPDKTITEVADIPATIGHLDYRENVFYATGFNEHKVFIVSMDGQILATIGNGNQATVNGRASEASFSQPNGIAVSKDGKYIFVSQNDGKLRKIIL
jgi:sugar lactone lactonase YvrE